MKIIICFPPKSGGNHLKNLLTVTKENIDSYIPFYKGDGTAHSRVGYNLVEEDLLTDLMSGHFGEIMVYQNKIQKFTNEKFIIISADTYNDRKLLSERVLGEHDKLKLDSNQDQEQLFLYKPFVFHHYFGTKIENIMDISVTEFFNDDINPVIDRINYFISKDLARDQVNQLHKIWKSKNNDDNQQPDMFT
jgi:hypothetical protein